MAAIDPTAAASTTAATGAAATLPKSSSPTMDRDAFMKLLVAQMRYQDPSKPMDSTEFLSQTAQFTNIELLQKLQDSQTQMLAFQSVVLSSSLVGKDVTGTALDGTTVTGKVDAATVVSGNGYLTIGTQKIPVTSVTEVR
jgi:flagellar basal-body rod modification protein FlgD